MHEIAKNRLFVIVGSSFFFMPVGANYLANSLAEAGYPIIFLEQPTLRFLLKHPLYILRLIKNLISPSLNKQNDINVIPVFSKFLPVRLKDFMFSLKLGFVYKIQETLLLFQIRKINKKLKVLYPTKNIITIFNDPFSFAVASKVKSNFLIFRVCDFYENYPGWELKKEMIINEERIALSQSDIILASSEAIYEKLLRLNLNKKIYLFPNAFAPFPGVLSSEAPADIKKLKKPIIGFVGSLNKWVDYELIEYISSKRPTYSFIFIGPLDYYKAKYLKKIKNIYLLGYKNRPQLINYYQFFDVAILPFKVNELTRGVNPLKLYEYLFFGLPVVSTPINEVKNLKKIVYVADTKDEFVLYLDKALLEKDMIEIKEQRKNFAMKNSWETRSQYLNLILDSHDREN